VTRISDPYTPIYNNTHRYRSRTAPQHVMDPDSEYGYRNPGGVGRMNEFYPPGNAFEKGTDPVVVAQFGQGPQATSRSAQMQAQSLGIQRTRTLNQHIDAYGRPFGFGYGGGFGFGFGGYPY